MSDNNGLYVGAEVLIQSRHRGLIKFLGTTDFDPQGRVWAGVELERPIGKHNGSVRGRTYFQAQEKHGTFVQPVQCELYDPEKAASSKIQAAARQRIAKNRFRRELNSVTFNALDNNDENLHIRRRNRLIAAGLAGTEAHRSTASGRSKLAEELSNIEVESSYEGAHLTFPLTEKQVYNMISSFKDGHPLHYKYTMQLLFAARDMNATKPTLVHTTVADNETFTICGDTHGQLQDLYSIFTINGTPSATNRYLFNGDFVDRGPYGAEIILTLFAFQQVFPNGCMLNRGNHEERSQNETGGFMSEILDKYNGFPLGDPNRGSLVYDAFQTCFDMLPLATLLEKGPRRVFIVHAGLFDRPGIRLEHIAAVNRKREIPWGRHTFEDRVFEDVLWSDPKHRTGTTPSTRGAGVFFGYDVTEEFCATNAISLVIRSHEMVQEGYQYMHNNRLLTIFSASRYCNRGTNKGAFITFDASLTNTIQQFMAGRLETTDPRPTEESENERQVEDASAEDELMQSDANRRMLIERICLNKHDLLWFWSKADFNRSGTVSKLKWAEGMRTILAPLDLPWLSLSKELVEFEPDGMINYIRFLERYRIEMSPENNEWQEAVIERVCEKLFSICSSLEEAYKMMDINRDGRIEYSEFVDALEKLEVGLSRPQLYELMSSIDTDKDAHIDFNEFAARFQVVFTRIKDARTDYTVPENLNFRDDTSSHTSGDELVVDDWTRQALETLGRALFSDNRNAAQVFESIDSDGDGSLSKDEFYHALSSLSFKTPFTRTETDKLFEVIDTNRSGTLNYLEFITAFKVADLGNAKRENRQNRSWQKAVIERIVHTLYEYRIELAAAFEKFDLDHSGYVSAEEFRVGLQALSGAIGAPITNIQADELMHTLDKNGDGSLSYEEFLTGFRLIDTSSDTNEHTLADTSSSKSSNASYEPSTKIGVNAAHNRLAT